MFTVECIQRDEFGSWGVKLRNSADGLYYWMDAYIIWEGNNYGDINFEWNQYIFRTDLDEDQHRMDVQDENFSEAHDEAFSALVAASEVIERDDGYYEVNEARAHWNAVVEIRF